MNTKKIQSDIVMNKNIVNNILNPTLEFHPLIREKKWKWNSKVTEDPYVHDSVN
jgi:hypothetical protein